MDVENFTETVTYAANQSDRWMFVALLVIGIIFISLMAKFFMKRFDDLQMRIDSQQLKFEKQNYDFVEHLKQNNKEMLEVIATAHSTISRNTIVMERLEKKLDLL
jgi:uncharacterized membrane-anchored protein YhcB (DUF1043 family)